MGAAGACSCPYLVLAPVRVLAPAAPLGPQVLKAPGNKCEQKDEKQRMNTSGAGGVGRAQGRAGRCWCRACWGRKGQELPLQGASAAALGILGRFLGADLVTERQTLRTQGFPHGTLQHGGAGKFFL